MNSKNSSFVFEARARAKGFRAIAGVDEAGRGPLAGPVVAAACMLPEGRQFPEIDDSKKLSASLREKLFAELTTDPEIFFGVGIVEPALIDQINILQATLLAMVRAVEALQSTPDYLLVDGIHAPKTAIPCETIVRGDALSWSIGAASIIAKVVRDRKMVELHQEDPRYGFAEHKGYGTAAHLAALQKYGPLKGIHRITYEPIKSMLQESLR